MTTHDHRTPSRIVGGATTISRKCQPTILDALEYLARACELKPEWWKMTTFGILTASATITVLGWTFFFYGLVGALRP